MTLKLAYNPTEGPVLVDEAGYVIGGRSWGPVDSTSPLAVAARDAGTIVDADEDALASSDNPDVVTALAALADRRQRLADAQAMDKAELVAALPPEQVEAMPVGGDGLPAKAELVDAVAAADPEAAPTEVPAEAPETTTTTASRSAAKKK